MSDINSFLQRKILPGKEFEALIPKSTCATTNLGDGDTDHSIEKMVGWIEKYSWQMQKVADVLEKSSLQKTCAAIFWFAYNHFQYHADQQDQMLRSPACSWKQRYTGIDCKSYSIIASSILTELDIFHYIRKIKQPGYEPTEWTHVYVVVPIDQQTGSMDSGYYVIDGTVSDNEEPMFIESKDEFMSGLRHIGLNGPDDETTTTGGTTTTGSTTSGTVIAAASSTSIWKKISLRNIMGLFSQPIGCFGGTGFDGAACTRDVESIQKFAVDKLNEVNTALEANDMAAVNAKINDYYVVTGAITSAIYKKLGERNWNDCSDKNFKTALQCAEFYRVAVADALDVWTDVNFDIVTSQVITYNSQMLKDNSIMPYCGNITPVATFPVTKWTFAKKPGVTVKPFQITEYVYTLMENPTTLNAQQFLTSLTTVYNAITNPSSVLNPGTNNPSNPGSTTNPGNPNNSNPVKAIDPKKPQTAGSTILMVALLGTAFWYGMDQFTPNKPAKKPTAK